MEQHKQFCKESNLKYEDTINPFIFIASGLTEQKADGQFQYNGKLPSYNGLKNVDKRRVYYMYYQRSETDFQLVNEWKEFRINPKTLESVNKPKWAT